MNQRSEIMNEYFVLKNELNWSNKFADQKTELVFEIDEEPSGRQVLYAKLDNDQKVRICEQWTGDIWKIDHHFGHYNLSDFLLNLLKIYNVEKSNSKITFNEYFFAEFNKLLGFK